MALQRLWAGLTGKRDPVAPPTSFDLDRVLYAVGDIHGQSGLLRKLLRTIEADAVSTRGGREISLVFVGDYIDRGPDSAGVIDLLANLEVDGTYVDMKFLMGNHERAMLNFLSDPLAGRGWLGMGGLQTLESFGVRGVTPYTLDEDLLEIAEDLEDALGTAGDSFLRERLELHCKLGNVVCCHAAMSPDKSVEAQNDDVLLWGDENFMEFGGPAGNWYVHGHVITPEAGMVGNRIEIDTGAYQTGRLTAARLDSQGVRFIEATMDS